MFTKTLLSNLFLMTMYSSILFWYMKNTHCSMFCDWIDVNIQMDVADKLIPHGIQIKPTSVPQLTQQKELLSPLRPYHSRLVGESYLARKRLVYECTDAQVVYLLLAISLICCLHLFLNFSGNSRSSLVSQQIKSFCYYLLCKEMTLNA
jgi:hypothetical protein